MNQDMSPAQQWRRQPAVRGRAKSGH